MGKGMMKQRKVRFPVDTEKSRTVRAALSRPAWGISRRDFLRMSGAGLAGAALLGVVGCARGMMKRNFPIAPLLIGVIVGPIAEQNYRRAMIQTGGSFEWALEPLTLTLLLLLAVLSFVASL
jgi:hypothetical protein